MGQDEGPNKQMQPLGAATPATVVDNGAIRPRNMAELIEFAKVLAYSGLVPKEYQGKVGDVIVAVQMGGEVGLSPMAALRGIAVINGRPSLWGDALAAVARSHPDCQGIEETFDQNTMTATCTAARRGAKPVTRTFSQEDAATAKLWGKAGPWTQYPKRMLQMRARGFCLRDAFPDALCGMDVAEEVLDSTGIGPGPLDASDFEMVIEATASAQSVEVPKVAEAQPERNADVAAEVGGRKSAELMSDAHRKDFVKALKAKGDSYTDAAIDACGLPQTWTTADAGTLRDILAKPQFENRDLHGDVT